MNKVKNYLIAGIGSLAMLSSGGYFTYKMINYLESNKEITEKDVSLMGLGLIGGEILLGIGAISEALRKQNKLEKNIIE